MDAASDVVDVLVGDGNVNGLFLSLSRISAVDSGRSAVVGFFSSLLLTSFTSVLSQVGAAAVGFDCVLSDIDISSAFILVARGLGMMSSIVGAALVAISLGFGIRPQSLGYASILTTLLRDTIQLFATLYTR